VFGIYQLNNDINAFTEKRHVLHHHAAPAKRRSSHRGDLWLVAAQAAVAAAQQALLPQFPPNADL
jgi:hypothetical protein